MSDRLTQNIGKLNKIKKADSSTRRKMLNNKELLYCICECVLNILADNVPLKQSQYNSLDQYKHKIRKLASKLVSDKQKKEIVQNGDGLLCGIITPTLDHLVGKMNIEDNDETDVSDVDESDADQTDARKDDDSKDDDDSDDSDSGDEEDDSSCSDKDTEEDDSDDEDTDVWSELDVTDADKSEDA
jgi:hypothetical protein